MRSKSYRFITSGDRMLERNRGKVKIDMKPGVVPWTIRLEKGSDFWEPNVSVVDQSGSPVTYIDTELIITPAGQDPIVWSPNNGKLLMIPGNFTFNVSRAEIDSYNWEQAEYKWSVTYSNGKVDKNWMEGVVKVDAN